MTPFNSDVLHRGIFSRLAVVGAILKSHEIMARDFSVERNLGAYIRGLFAATLLLASAYGAVLGMFEPGLQTAYAALKLPLILIGTALLCTPTFYVFNSIFGSRLTLPQSLAVIFLLTASTTVMLAAFAPIAWFFTVSTHGVGFLMSLHAAIFGVAFLFGIRLLGLVGSLLNEYLGYAVRRPFLLAWFTLVLFVGLQMAYTFRPLILPGPFHSGERGLFFEGWGASSRN